MGETRYNSDLERFMAHTQEEEHGYDTPCLQWKAGTFKSGYGHFNLWIGNPPKVRSVRTHKWLYEQLVGPVPEGMELDHKCRNILCCNPGHLEPVPHKENVVRGSVGLLKPGRTSQYRGVSWDKQMKKWIAKIRLNKQQYNLGYHDTEEGAYQAYCTALDHYEQDGSVPSSKKLPKTSKYQGVHWDSQREKWHASTRILSKKVSLGRFDTEEGAYQAYLDAIEKKE